MNIYDLSFEELESQLISLGAPAFRAKQVYEGLYRHLWSHSDQFTNLSKQFRQKIFHTFSDANDETIGELNLTGILPVQKLASTDKETVKTLFSLHDGRQVEAVLMRYARRRTLCISTQAGCAMGCVFCATGQMGYKRNLSSGEIIEQVLYYARQLTELGEQVTNIVVMGMGEPFHNYEATMSAIRRLNDPAGFNLGSRRFTISTVGLIPAIRRFTDEHTQINLAISLHAACDGLRSQLLPINKRYPLDELFSACQEYIQKTHRRLTFEWALIDGVNDTAEQAHLLAKQLKRFRIGGSILCHVNLIQLNPTRKYSGHGSSRQKALDFKNILVEAGIPSTIRLRRGIDIQAGCGQLASLTED